MRKLLRVLSLVLLVMTAAQAFDVNASETLFEYPQAPNDTTMKLEERCNYLTQHWWDKMNFSAPIPESKDSLLVEAMTTYIEVMKNANFNVGLASIRDLMFKAQTNQPNFMKIAAVAQLLLYYNNASVKDDVYETFAKAVVDAPTAMHSQQQTQRKDSRLHAQHNEWRQGEADRRDRGGVLLAVFLSGGH